MTRLPENTPLPEWKKEMDRQRLRSLADLFPAPKPVIGMVHLWPLPGAPGYNGYGMQTIIDHALRDAEALLQGGVDGLMVENMWDLPYYVGNDVKPEAMTAHAVAAAEVVNNSRCRSASTSFTTAEWCAWPSLWQPKRASYASAFLPARVCGIPVNLITAARRN